MNIAVQKNENCRLLAAMANEKIWHSARKPRSFANIFLVASKSASRTFTLLILLEQSVHRKFEYELRQTTANFG